MTKIFFTKTEKKSYFKQILKNFNELKKNVSKQIS